MLGKCLSRLNFLDRLHGFIPLNDDHKPCRRVSRCAVLVTRDSIAAVRFFVYGTMPVQAQFGPTPAGAACAEGMADQVAAAAAAWVIRRGAG